MGYDIYTQKDHSAVQGNKPLKYTATWMDPKDKMLCKESWSQNVPPLYDSIIQHSQNTKIIKLENRSVATIRGQAEGKWLQMGHTQRS